jgi:hypothetical protein
VPSVKEIVEAVSCNCIVLQTWDLLLFSIRIFICFLTEGGGGGDKLYLEM